MRVVVDMQGAQSGSRYRGIGRYTRSLIQELARQASGRHEVWLVLNAQLPEGIEDLRLIFEPLIPTERIRIFRVPCSQGTQAWSTHAAEMIREDFLAKLGPDVVLVSSIFETHWENAVTSIGAVAGEFRTAAILFDLIPLIYQKQYLVSADLREYYFRKVDWLKRADLLLAISKSSQREGIENLGLKADQIVNVSAAVGQQFSRKAGDALRAPELLSRLGIVRDIVMYAPGGFDFRKNFARLIEAYGIIPGAVRNKHQLVIVSKLTSMQRRTIEHLGRKLGLRADELVLTDYVSDEDLVTLYTMAKLFVFPSLHEGFGLPLLEAMACGAPVIGSNCTSIPEVIGRDDALFDPYDVSAISRKLQQALAEPHFLDSLRQHSVRQAAQFSWRRSANLALTALEELHARRGSSQEQPADRARQLIDSIAKLGAMPHSDAQLRDAANCIAFNTGHSTPQLLLDISTLVQSDARSGIQRVVRSLLREFLRTPPTKWDVSPIYWDEGIYRYASRFANDLFGGKQFEEDAPVQFCQDDVYLALDLNMHLTGEVHETHRLLRLWGIRLFFVVYDILPIKRPDWWAKEAALMFSSWFENIKEVSTGLICISQTVAGEVDKWIKQNPCKRPGVSPRISYFHLGADLISSLPSRGIPDSAPVILSALDKRRSFLIVSTLDPRKGHLQALDAFDQLWADGIDVNLVFVGQRGWNVDQLVNRIERHRELNRRFFWLQAISDEYLEKIYAASTCLIAASEDEGFGLPLIEAAQHQLPMIVRDIPVFREVTADHAYYFSGLTPEDLARSVTEWLTLFAQGEHPKSEQMPWLTWRQSAQQLVQQLSRPDPGSSPDSTVVGRLSG